MTFEFRTLSQAASFGAPAASTKTTIAIQREMEAAKLIKYGGRNQNSTTPRYYITALGMQRLEELRAQAHKQQLLEDCEQEDSEAQEHAAPEAAPAKGEPKKGRKPGTGKNAGKRIYAKCKVNPRRAGTFGWHSYNMLLNKPEGVAYEDYISAGGRAKDLAWDVARKWAEVK